jgi:hypothetical protein
VDERRKRVLLIAASILAARKLVNWDGRPSPAFESFIAVRLQLQSGSWRELMHDGQSSPLMEVQRP